MEKFKSYNYSLGLINKIKEVSKNDTSTVQKICSLNYEIAYAYVEAIKKFVNDTSCNMEEVEFIAMHGQTIWHNPNHMDGYFLLLCKLVNLLLLPMNLIKKLLVILERWIWLLVEVEPHSFLL